MIYVTSIILKFSNFHRKRGEIAQKRLKKRHDLSKPLGVRGRNADLRRLRQVLGREPKTTLKQGMPIVYRWIELELQKTGRIPHRSRESTLSETREINTL
jgi:hypothetical protein